MKRSRPPLFLNFLTLFALLLSMLGSAVLVTPAHAAGIVVNTTEDELNADGDCSLREAIQAANTDAAVDNCTAGSGADIISVPAGTYTLTIPPTGSGSESTNQDGDLDITSDLTIQGDGAVSTIIQAGTLGYPDASANGIGGVFQISNSTYGAPSYNVVINNVTVANGKNPQYGAGAGVLMFAGSTLNLSNVVFSGHNASAPGGAIFAWGGTIGITNSIFSDNRSMWGGAIYIQSSGVLNVTNSSFMDNLAYDINGGGALAISGTSTIVNSTFSNNRAPVHSGGGIYYNGPSLRLYNNTFTGNSARWGGALKVEGTAYLYNNILANSAPPSEGYFPTDCHNYGTIYGNNNLIETDDGMYPCATDMTNTILNADPRLTGPMQDPTMPEPKVYFFEPALTSPVIEAGDPAVCSAEPVFSQDQRGVARPQGYICDIGSDELVLTPGYNLVEADGSTDVAEGGAVDTYTLMLTYPPEAGKDVTITTTPDTQVTTDPSSVIFTSANWNIPQTVTVTAVNDAVIEGAHTGVITHTVTSADATYDGFTVVNVTANIADNDFPAPAVTLNPAAIDFGGQLIGTTSAAQTVTLTNTGTAQLHVGTLTFTSDWILSNDLCSGATVILGGTCTFEVAFHPLSGGPLTGSVNIPSDAPTSEDVVSLSGNSYIPKEIASFISVGAQDGHAVEKNETAEYGGSSSAAGGYLQIGDSNADRQVKGFLSFDTSSLPDNAVITSVRIEMYLIGAAGTNPFTTHGNLNVDLANPSFDTLRLLPGDFQVSPTAADVAICGTALSPGWFGCDLVSNLGDLNLTGTTQFRLWFDLPDNDDLRPDYLKIASGNYPRAVYRPVLIVEYYVP